MFLFIDANGSYVLENVGFFLLGFIASLLAMTSGGEGAILFVTAFTWIGLDPHVSVGTAFVTQIFGKSVGTISWGIVGKYEEEQVVLWRKLVPLIAICISFVAIGMLFIKCLPGNLIKFIFGMVCIALAYFMICAKGHWKKTDFHWKKLLSWKNLLCLSSGGFFTGVIAVGAGALTTYVLHCRLHLEIRKAAATAVALLPFVSVIGLLIYWSLVKWDIAIPTIIGVCCGGAAGPWIATCLQRKGHTKWIKYFYIGLTLTMGIGMLLSTVLSMI
jgi:uncharacterized membrane protein YfcA